jgi:ribonuclease P protein component
VVWAEEAMSEAHVPTQYAPSGEEPRVPSSHVDARGPRHHRRPPSQGPHEAQRLTERTTIWRLRGRHNIESVRRARRCASGPVWVRFVALTDGETPPEVGYAIGKAVGGAVARNLVRRRLRAVIADLAADLRPGRYLLGVSRDAAAIPFAELAAATRSCLAAAGALAE